jgi:hypothetical protein
LCWEGKKGGEEALDAVASGILEVFFEVGTGRNKFLYEE